ncbi:MAG: ATP-binding cassette domain-containing protein [Actinobacteria bacterium]|nr:ATP-binding cassette domain-containing protein [Actinomycetota bacterium]
MAHIAIRGENISKQYRIGGAQRYVALRDVIAGSLTRPSKRAGREARSGGRETFWALKDVSFEINQGELIGIIGRNGAGKTTLLKILTRITRPTEGFAELHGRVGSLLEVGTGFHPELTGRENVYFNGGILGMTKKEIDSKLDEIFAFAETERFADTVVKHYSSGMQVRLAFSVAAHLEPEILLVDEVLAVGDMRFQKKCLEKLTEVAKGGHTILFVSHQMNHIRRLCQRVIWLDKGSIRMSGPTSEVISAYEAASVSSDETKDSTRTAEIFTGWCLTDSSGESGHRLANWDALTVSFGVSLNRSVEASHHAFILVDTSGTVVWGSWADGFSLPAGTHQLTYSVPSLPLRPGSYRWTVGLWEQDTMLELWDCTPELEIATAPVGHWMDEWAGLLNIPVEFEVR